MASCDDFIMQTTLSKQQLHFDSVFNVIWLIMSEQKNEEIRRGSQQNKYWNR